MLLQTTRHNKLWLPSVRLHFLGQSWHCWISALLLSAHSQPCRFQVSHVRAAASTRSEIAAEWWDRHLALLRDFSREMSRWRPSGHVGCSEHVITGHNLEKITHRRHHPGYGVYSLPQRCRASWCFFKHHPVKIFNPSGWVVCWIHR